MNYVVTCDFGRLFVSGVVVLLWDSMEGRTVTTKSDRDWSPMLSGASSRFIH
jgi:hypothetical protein